MFSFIFTQSSAGIAKSTRRQGLFFLFINSMFGNWTLCKKFDHTNKTYTHNPEPVLENETQKLLWDFVTLTDHQILARRLDLVILNKKGETVIQDNLKVKLKESE